MIIKKFTLLNWGIELEKNCLQLTNLICYLYFGALSKQDDGRGLIIWDEKKRYFLGVSKFTPNALFLVELMSWSMKSAELSSGKKIYSIMSFTQVKSVIQSYSQTSIIRGSWGYQILAKKAYYRGPCIIEGAYISLEQVS